MQTQQNAVGAYAQKIIKQVRKAVVGKDKVLLWVLAALRCLWVCRTPSKTSLVVCR